MKTKIKSMSLADVWILTYGRGVRQARVSDLMKTAGYVTVSGFMLDYDIGSRCELSEVTVLIAWARDPLWLTIK